MAYRSPVLASVLPGVRDVRVPLASGLLWLLSAWLVLEPHFPDAAPEPGTFLARIYPLVEFFGVGGVVGAILFTAYLVGIIVAFERVRLGQIPSKVDGLMASSTYDHLKSYLSPDLQKAVKELEEHGQWRTAETAAGHSHQAQEAWSTEIAYDLYREESALANRLRIQSNKEVYQSYDAKVAEANFRQAIALPLAVLALVLALNVSWFWLAAWLIPALLLVLAGSARKETRSELIEAVIGNLIESTSIQHFRTAAEDGDVPVLIASLKGQAGIYVPHESPHDDGHERRRVVPRREGA